MATNEAFHKLVSVFGMGCFTYPGCERAVVINGNFWDFGKQQIRVSYDVILVVEAGPSGELGVVTTCGEHVLGWTVMGSLEDFANSSAAQQ
jgi:hypothetical protein